MKVGDLVTATWVRGFHEKPRPVLGIVLCIDPEEIGDNEEVEVKWTSGFHDCSNHSTWNLEMINEQD